MVTILMPEQLFALDSAWGKVKHGIAFVHRNSYQFLKKHGGGRAPVLRELLNSTSFTEHSIATIGTLQDGQKCGCRDKVAFLRRIRGSNALAPLFLPGILRVLASEDSISDHSDDNGESQVAPGWQVGSLSWLLMIIKPNVLGAITTCSIG